MQHPDNINNVTTNNGTPPPCQNIMFPIPDQSPLYNYYYYNDNYYQPIINIPTRSSAATLGEVGASVELVRAQLTELSRRMESVECRFSEFEKCVSVDISLLKNTISEHATELLKMGDKAIELGMIRRRLSKVENFKSDFYEQFENFKGVKDIISKLSDHVGECDQSISSIIKTNVESQIVNSHDDDQNGDKNVAVTSTLPYSSPYVTSTVVDLNIYFSEYDDNRDYEEDDFEKL
jgi:hypothetical protein